MDLPENHNSSNRTNSGPRDERHTRENRSDESIKWPTLPRFTRTSPEQSPGDLVHQPSAANRRATYTHADVAETPYRRETLAKSGSRTPDSHAEKFSNSRNPLSRNNPVAVQRTTGYARAVPRARTSSSGSGPKKSNKIMIQLMVCLLLFVTALIVKMVSPESAQAVKEIIDVRIGRGVDYKATAETLGRVLSNEGNISEVFESLSDGFLIGAPKQDVAALPDDSSPQLSDTDVDSTGGIFGEDSDFFADAVSDRTISLPAEEGEVDVIVDTATPVPTGYDSFGLTLSGWEFSLSEADRDDDTAPIPFGTTLPARADYTVYTLPFAYATPLSGVETSGYGFRDHPVDNVYKFHYGADIAGDTGDPINAFADGTVTATGESESYGKYIIIEHSGGFSTLYAHCSRIVADDGQSVNLGQLVARVGETGKATGPHLHFEILYNGKSVDPTRYLSFRTAV